MRLQEALPPLLPALKLLPGLGFGLQLGLLRGNQQIGGIFILGIDGCYFPQALHSQVPAPFFKGLHPRQVETGLPVPCPPLLNLHRHALQRLGHQACALVAVRRVFRQGA